MAGLMEPHRSLQEVPGTRRRAFGSAARESEFSLREEAGINISEGKDPLAALDEKPLLLVKVLQSTVTITQLKGERPEQAPL